LLLYRERAKFPPARRKVKIAASIANAMSRTKFGLTTPPEEIAAVRSKNGFLEVPLKHILLAGRERFMFERFTDRARKVMATANEQVRRFNHQYIGTEHIFLGLVMEGGTGADVLKNLGINIEKMLPEVEQLFKLKGGRDTVDEGKIPQTQNAIKVIEFAIDEARNLNNDYIGTEHILLGLLRVSEGIAAQVMANLGVNIEGVRMEIEKLPNRQE
jgi:hypothetical protein